MTTRRVVTLAAVVLAAAAGAYVYFNYNPSSSSMFPKCIVLVLTGYKCPGCGTQRAIHALLHGNVAAAWHYNAMMVTALPVMALYGTAQLLRRRCPRFYWAINHEAVLWTIFTLIVLWWVLRNVFGW